MRSRHFPDRVICAAHSPPTHALNMTGTPCSSHPQRFIIHNQTLALHVEEMHKHATNALHLQCVFSVNAIIYRLRAAGSWHRHSPATGAWSCPCTPGWTGWHRPGWTSRRAWLQSRPGAGLQHTGRPWGNWERWGSFSLPSQLWTRGNERVWRR